MRKLALQGLNNGYASLSKSSSYVLLSSSEEQGIEYALSSLATDTSNLILSEDIERFFAKDVQSLFNWSWNDMTPYCLSFRLNRQDFLKKDGVKRLLEELLFYPQVHHGHLIIHLSEELLITQTIANIKQLIKTVDNFIRQHEATVVWVLTGDHALTFLDELRHFNHVVAGLVIATTEAVSQTLFIDFWRNESDYLTKVSCQVSSKCPLTINVLKKQDVGHFQQFTDQNQVLISQALVPSNTKLPPHYTVYDNNSTLYSAALKMQAATVIFEINKTTDLLKLGEQCFLLRKNAGNWLKIVLKNSDGVIRHKDECIFLTVGVNLILHNSTDISRLMSQVQAIQGYKFARPLPKQFSDVVSYTLDVKEKGYLSVFRFIEEVLKHRESSINTGVSGVLIVLKLQKGLQIQTVLPLFTIKRHGDIFTATDTHIYLYLNACRENDVELALSRLFRLSLGEFFLFHDIYSSETGIEEQCRILRKIAMNNNVIDYTKEISTANITQLAPKPSDNREHASTAAPDYNRPNATPIKLGLKKDHE